MNLSRIEEENTLKMERLRSSISVGDKAIANDEAMEFYSAKELNCFFDNLLITSPLHPGKE